MVSSGCNGLAPILAGISGAVPGIRTDSPSSRLDKPLLLKVYFNDNACMFFQCLGGHF